jgi:hypothetical protein
MFYADPGRRHTVSIATDFYLHSLQINRLIREPSSLPLAVLKMKNPGGLFSSPGFGISCLTLSSGYPIGEPRRNYRYRDNNSYYNDVENKSADAQLRLTARGHEVEHTVGTTIGHSIFQSEEMDSLKQAKPV